MASNDDQSGETILPGGVEVNVPGLTVARALGTLVYNQATGAEGLYVSEDAASASYSLIGANSITSGPGIPEIESLIIGSNPADGETYTLTVTTGSVIDEVVYEFDNDASVTAGRTLVTIGATTADTEANLRDAINETQGWDGGTEVVSAQTLWDPLTITAVSTSSVMTQTDGTGGDITFKQLQVRIAADTFTFFHIFHIATAQDVTNGKVIVSLPAGFEAVQYSILMYDGGKAGGMTIKAFDGTQAADIWGLATIPQQITITQGAPAAFVATDAFVVWGYMKRA
jgi:hypothetical protein